MKINRKAINLVTRFEGMHRVRDGQVHPYLCPANVWTQGVGTTVNPDSKKRITKYSPPIKQAKAKDWLKKDMESKYGKATKKHLKTDLSDDSFGALTSLCYNIGTGALKRSTVLRKINEENWEDVPRAWRMWRVAGGRVLRGLERRRDAELLLFNSGLSQKDTLVDIDNDVQNVTGVAGFWTRLQKWIKQLWS